MTAWLDWLDQQEFRRQWALAEGVTYLNHGSFGPPPAAVRCARDTWQDALDANPMDFFMRRYEAAWLESRLRLGALVGAVPDRLVFAENATAAMNIVAASLTLSPHDEVVLTDHEYGAVQRIWQRATLRAGAAPPRVARLPLPVRTAGQVTDAIFQQVTQNTRLLVVSHITSPTAITLPVREIIAAARQRQIPVCVDGPHAVAQLDLQLDDLDCDFYCASCHKWLSAPFGSGFLYVAPRQQSGILPQQLSWGRLPPEAPDHWSDEFRWSGTRDPSSYFTIPAAIDFLAQVGWTNFREATHALASYARQQLVELFGHEPIAPDSPEWYGSMAHVPLPPGDAIGLRRQLWEQHRIEVPIIDWNGGRWIRVSCHLYNTRQDIDRLVAALKTRVERGN